MKWNSGSATAIPCPMIWEQRRLKVQLLNGPIVASGAWTSVLLISNPDPSALNQHCLRSKLPEIQSTSEADFSLFSCQTEPKYRMKHVILNHLLKLLHQLGKRKWWGLNTKHMHVFAQMTKTSSSIRCEKGLCFSNGFKGTDLSRISRMSHCSGLDFPYAWNKSVDLFNPVVFCFIFEYSILREKNWWMQIFFFFNEYSCVNFCASLHMLVLKCI